MIKPELSIAMREKLKVGSYYALAYLVTLTCFAYLVGSGLVLDGVLYVAFLGLIPTLVAALILKEWLWAAVAAVAIFTAITYPKLSEGFHMLEVWRGKQYVVAIAPLLDQYKKDHGSYPESLNEIANLPPPPAPMKYEAFGGDYFITIYDPQNFDFDRYNSAIQVWYRDH